MVLVVFLVSSNRRGLISPASRKVRFKIVLDPGGIAILVSKGGLCVFMWLRCGRWLLFILGWFLLLPHPGSPLCALLLGRVSPCLCLWMVSSP